MIVLYVSDYIRALRISEKIYVFSKIPLIIAIHYSLHSISIKDENLYCSSLVFALKRIRTCRLRKVNIRRNWVNSFAKYLLKFYEKSTRDHRKLLNRWIAFTIPRFFHKQTAANALKPFRGEAAESFPTKILRWWTKL